MMTQYGIAVVRSLMNVNDDRDGGAADTLAQSPNMRTYVCILNRAAGSDQSFIELSVQVHA